MKKIRRKELTQKASPSPDAPKKVSGGWADAKTNEAPTRFLLTI